MSITIQTIKKVDRDTHPYGSILYGSTYLGYIENAQQWYNTHHAGKQVLVLGFLKENKILALRVSGAGLLNVEDFSTALEYECPYTKFLHPWAIPTAIITEDIGIYMDSKSLFFNMAGDLDWILEHNYVFDDRGDLVRSPIDKVLNGAGYTYGTNIHDGNPSTVSYKTQLSNGDVLLFSGHMWHNK